MNHREILEKTVLVAEEAGEVLLRYLGELSGVEYKGEVDLVTEADRASEALVVKRLTALLPEASVLAEEGSRVDRPGNRRWIVDPLDGTTNFAHSYPLFCVSIALEEEGNVVLGVIHDPTRKESFTAVRGEGAFRNGERLRVSGTGRLEHALLVTGFPYDVRTGPRDNLLQFRAMLKRARAVRRDGTAALDLAYLAAGRFDGFWEESLAPWDVAAGALLVEEAGGRVTEYDGSPLRLHGGNILATNGGVHGEMQEILAEIEGSGELPPVSVRVRND